MQLRAFLSLHVIFNFSIRQAHSYMKSVWREISKLYLPLFLKLWCYKLYHFSHWGHWGQHEPSYISSARVEATALHCSLDFCSDELNMSVKRQHFFQNAVEFICIYDGNVQFDALLKPFPNIWYEIRIFWINS